MRWAVLVATGGVVWLGCGESAPAEPDAQVFSCPVASSPVPNHTQFVADRWLLPTENTVELYGLDLDRDDRGRPDNAIGQILVAITSGSSVDLQGALDDRVNGGEVLNLFDVEAISLTTATGVGVWHSVGDDCDAPADPKDNFTGEESFERDPAEMSLMTGQIVGGRLRAGPGNMTLRIVLFGASLLDLPLIGSRVEADITEDAISNGRIGGAVLETHVRGDVIPALAEGIQAIIDAECTGAPPDCCAGGAGEDYVVLFDADDDCEITPEEIENNALLSSLFQPDLDLLDSTRGDTFDPNRDGVKESLSIGLGFTAVRARFQTP